jgi:hypothetical protein
MPLWFVLLQPCFRIREMITIRKNAMSASGFYLEGRLCGGFLNKNTNKVFNYCFLNYFSLKNILK